jgi:hypothetical protein
VPPSQLLDYGEGTRRTREFNISGRSKRFGILFDTNLDISKIVSCFIIPNEFASARRFKGSSFQTLPSGHSVF